LEYFILLSSQIADHLPLEEVTIAETLRDAGYATFFADAVQASS
jgi:arylsulfatase A-like enzyme